MDCRGNRKGGSGVIYEIKDLDGKTVKRGAVPRIDPEERDGFLKGHVCGLEGIYEVEESEAELLVSIASGRDIEFPARRT